MLKGIPNPTWMSEVTEHFNFTKEVKGSEIVSQKTNKDDRVSDSFWSS